MLVLICAIRKVMECLFTRRELRVLDDLLPENSDKSARRKGGGPRSDLFRRLNWVNDDYEAEKAKEETRGAIQYTFFVGPEPLWSNVWSFETCLNL